MPKRIADKDLCPQDIASMLENDAKDAVIAMLAVATYRFGGN